jgi:hypothetical protein
MDAKSTAARETFQNMSADTLETATKSEPEAPVVQPKARDPFDPLGWELPVACKDCDRQFKVPYRHYQAGIVFHCPHCHGSYVPTLPMYQRIHEAFETFYGKMRREREEMKERGADDAAFKQSFERELPEFHSALERMARELHPAGKLVRRKGLAAMFT